jgi:hypothetical protein
MVIPVGDHFQVNYSKIALDIIKPQQSANCCKTVRVDTLFEQKMILMNTKTKKKKKKT